MRPNKMIVEAAIEQAELSLSDFRTGAVVFYKGNVQGEGFNVKDKTHPKSPHPYHVQDAEFAAVIDAVRGVDGYYGYTPDLLKGCGLLVYRILKNGKPAFSKPCNECAWMIERVGIKRSDVYFSITTGSKVLDESISSY